MSSKIEKQIVATAAAEFAKSGFFGITTADLARSAAVTEGSVFRIFGTKEKLFDAAVKHAIAQVENEIATVQVVLADESTDEIETPIRRAVRRTYEIISLDFVRLRAFAVLERPELSAQFDHCILGYEKAFTRVFEMAVVGGKFRDDLDPHVVAHQLLACVLDCKLFGPVSAAGKSSPSDKRRRSSVDAFVEILLRGIGKPASKARQTR